MISFEKIRSLLRRIRTTAERRFRLTGYLKFILSDFDTFEMLRTSNYVGPWVEGPTNIWCRYHSNGTAVARIVMAKNVDKNYEKGFNAYVTPSGFYGVALPTLADAKKACDEELKQYNYKYI